MILSFGCLDFNKYHAQYIVSPTFVLTNLLMFLPGWWLIIVHHSYTCHREGAPSHFSKHSPVEYRQYIGTPPPADAMVVFGKRPTTTKELLFYCPSQSANNHATNNNTKFVILVQEEFLHRKYSVCYSLLEQAPSHTVTKAQRQKQGRQNRNTVARFCVLFSWIRSQLPFEFQALQALN